MRKLFFSLFVACLIASPHATFGQEARHLARAIDQLEQTLLTLVREESTQHRNEVDRLYASIAELRETAVTPPPAHATGVEQQLDSLGAAVDSLGYAVERSRTAAGDGQEAVQALARDLDSLVTALKASLAALEAREAQAAEAKPPAPVEVGGVKLSGTLFARYWWDYSGAGAERDANRFEVERVYLTASGPLSETVGFRATTDVYQSKADANLSWVFILKYAYVDWKPRPWLTLRGGMIPTEWIEYVDKAWKYRGVEKSLPDLEGFQSSTDVGLAATVALPHRWGEAALHVQNGSGYRSQESNRYKDVAGRLALTPFARHEGVLKPLQVGGHVYAGRFNDGRARTRWGVLAAYATGAFSAGVSYDTRVDSTLTGSGLSAFGELKLKVLDPHLKPFSLVGRYDRLDPDAVATGDEQGRSILGLAYKPNANLTLVVTRQQVTRQQATFKRYDGADMRSTGRYALHCIVSY